MPSRQHQPLQNAALTNLSTDFESFANSIAILKGLVSKVDIVELNLNGRIASNLANSRFGQKQREAVEYCEKIFEVWEPISEALQTTAESAKPFLRENAPTAIQHEQFSSNDLEALAGRFRALADLGCELKAWKVPSIIVLLNDVCNSHVASELATKAVLN